MGVTITVTEGSIRADVLDAGEAEMVDLIDEIARLGIEEGIHRALVVVAQSKAVGTLERHKLGIHAAKTLPRVTRLAIVAGEGQINYMFQNTARTRGAMVRVFADVESAAAWLGDA